MEVQRLSSPRDASQHLLPPPHQYAQSFTSMPVSPLGVQYQPLAPQPYALHHPQYQPQSFMPETQVMRQHRNSTSSTHSQLRYSGAYSPVPQSAGVSSTHSSPSLSPVSTGSTTSGTPAGSPALHGVPVFDVTHGVGNQTKFGSTALYNKARKYSITSEGSPQLSHTPHESKPLLADTTCMPRSHHTQTTQNSLTCTQRRTYTTQPFHPVSRSPVPHCHVYSGEGSLGTTLDSKASLKFAQLVSAMTLSFLLACVGLAVLTS